MGFWEGLKPLPKAHEWWVREAPGLPAGGLGGGAPQIRFAPSALPLSAVPIALVLGAFLLPYAAALRLGGARVGALAVFTVKLAGWSTLMALGLGLPGAALFAAGNRRFTAVIKALTAIPFAMPPILVVLGFVLFFGNAGWLNRGPLRLRILYRPEAIVLAHGFYNFPLVIRLVGDSLARARRSCAAAAATLGASGLVTAVTVLLPLALPALAAASCLVFLYCFTSFALVLVLGGGPQATTLAVEIYRYARMSLDFERAGGLALVETVIAGLVFAVYLYAVSRNRLRQELLVQSGPPLETGAGSAGSRAALVIYALALILLVAGPLLSVPVESFLYRPSRSAAPVPSLRWWAGLGETCLPALGRSLVLACLSASIAVIAALLGASAARLAPAAAPVIRLLLSLPMASSGIVLGLGWLRLYGREHSRTIAAVAALHAVAALPFAYASIAEGLRAIPGSLAAAARVSGAGPLTALVTVEIPLAARSAASAWGFAAAISLGELNAILMLGMEDWETLPLLIYRAAGAYRYGVACAAGTLLLLCCFTCFLVSERLGSRA